MNWFELLIGFALCILAVLGALVLFLANAAGNETGDRFENKGLLATCAVIFALGVLAIYSGW